MNSKKTKSKKLSLQIGLILSVMLIVVFTIFIATTVILSSKALGDSISSDFKNISEKYAAQVQATFDGATSVATDLQTYLTGMYKEYDRQVATNTLDKELVDSQVVRGKILPINRDIEDYLVNSIRNAVVNNDNIMAAGAYFEPYAYDPAAKEYAIYIDVSAPEVFQESKYADYSKEDYYKIPMETGKPYFTPPYNFDGVMMVSASYPILSNGVTQGVVLADINVSNFNQYAVETSVYPTAFNEILTDDGTIVFDSTDLSGIYVGMSVHDFVSDPVAIEAIANGMTTKAFFSLDSIGSDGQRVSRFYAPLTAGEQTWWSLLALDKSDMNKTTTSTVITLIILAIVSLVVTICIALYVLNKKISPINKVVTAAESIANGHLNITVDVNSNNEIGVLANSFGVMSDSLKQIISDVNHLLGEMADGNFTVKTTCENKYVGDYANILAALRKINGELSDTLTQINQSSDQVSSGADQVSSGAQALSQGATEQASSVEELAATIAEISSQVNQNANSAKEAKEQANHAGEEILDSNSKMETMITAMSDISNKSGEIGKIIKTIEDIAFQTNILALNAAVEAARAGAAGKGFAVVADEVRNLASKSADAAKNTTSLIQETIEAVNRGTSIADDTAKSMLAVVDSAKAVTVLVDQIAGASDEQASSIAQVTQGVDQISSVVQTNSATAEESAAASEELSGQAAVLKSLVSKFKLKEHNEFGSSNAM